MSGLNQRFTKPSSLYWDREFESHFLRQNFPALERTKEKGADAPFSFICMISGILKSHPRNTTLFTIVLVRKHKNDCGNTDKQIDECLNRWPRAEKKIHHIPTTIHV